MTFSRILALVLSYRYSTSSLGSFTYIYYINVYAYTLYIYSFLYSRVYLYIHASRFGVVDGRWCIPKLDVRDLKVLSALFHSRHLPSGIPNIHIAYTHTHTHTRTHTHDTHTHTHTHTHTYIYIYIYSCIQMYIYTYCIYVYMHCIQCVIYTHAYMRSRGSVFRSDKVTVTGSNKTLLQVGRLVQEP